MARVGENLLASRIRSGGRAHWIGFFGAMVLGWALLFSTAIPADLRSFEAIYGTSLVELLCGGGLGATGFAATFAMWALMSAAMMAPTALPAVATYDDLSTLTATGFARLTGGYLTAWIGFSALAAGAQVALFELGPVGGLGQNLSVPLTMALLIGAGAYQFSALKHAGLSRGRAPLNFLMQHRDEGPVRNGLRLGLDCVGGGWALMLLGFVGGTMNLGFMGLAMVLMTLEKRPDIGRYLTRPLGAILIASGLMFPLF